MVPAERAKSICLHTRNGAARRPRRAGIFRDYREREPRRLRRRRRRLRVLLLFDRLLAETSSVSKRGNPAIMTISLDGSEVSLLVWAATEKYAASPIFQRSDVDLISF